MTLPSGRLLLCLLTAPLFLSAQNQPPATPTTQAAPAPAPPPAATQATPATPSPSAPPKPKFTLNPNNTGMGLSFEPMYWMTDGHMALHTGDYNNTGVPGDLGYPGKLTKDYGAVVMVPAGNNGDFRFEYFQTQSSGSSFAAQNLNFFGNAVGSGDPLGVMAKLTSYKLSYDYVTYFWNFSRGDVRLKTLYEVQYASIDTNVADFQLQTDGSYNLNAFGGTKSIIAPSFGLDLDGTLSQHFRWELRGTGWGLPHRSKIGDGEVSIAYRLGHYEIIAGGKAYYFRTSRRADHFDVGAPFGPFVGLRFYWKKK